MRALVFILILSMAIVSCASRESFGNTEQYRASFIFNKCYDVFSVKYPPQKIEVLEFFIDERGMLRKDYSVSGSTLKKRLGRCFYKNAKRYNYTPSTRESNVSFRFKYGPARKLR